MHCRAAVIDEIELAQQLDHGGGTIVGSKFLEPYLHTISGTELTQLQKKQWGEGANIRHDNDVTFPRPLVRLPLVQEIRNGNPRLFRADSASRISLPLHLHRADQTSEGYELEHTGEQTLL